MGTDLTQQLSETEITNYQVAWPGGSPLIEYVSTKPPYRVYRWDGTRLVTSGGGSVQNSLTPGSTTAAPSVDAVVGGLAGKADYFATPAVLTATAITFSAASHANRVLECSNASAQVFTFNTGGGFAAGDSGRIFQNGAGPVSIVSGTATVVLSPNVTTAVTTGARSFLDWEINLAGQLVVTAVGAAVGSSITVIDMTPAATVGASQTNATVGSATIPANVILAGKLMRIEVQLSVQTNATTTFEFLYGGQSVSAGPASQYNAFGTTKSLQFVVYIAGTGGSSQASGDIEAASPFGSSVGWSPTVIKSTTVDATASQTLILRTTTGTGTTAITMLVGKILVY